MSNEHATDHKVQGVWPPAITNAAIERFGLTFVTVNVNKTVQVCSPDMFTQFAMALRAIRMVPITYCIVSTGTILLVCYRAKMLGVANAFQHSLAVLTVCLLGMAAFTYAASLCICRLAGGYAVTFDTATHHLTRSLNGKLLSYTDYYLVVTKWPRNYGRNLGGWAVLLRPAKKPVYCISDPDVVVAARLQLDEARALASHISRKTAIAVRDRK